MILDQFWPTDVQFSKIAPHLLTDTRGKARVYDRRLISGIVQVLKSGRRWIEARMEYGPKKTLHNLYVRWPAQGVWMDLFHALAQEGGPSVGVLIDSSAVTAHRSASGGKRVEKNQAIGRSHGGRTTNIHALTDANRRPIAFTFTGGNVADCLAAAGLLARLPACESLHSDKGCDRKSISFFARR